MCERTCATELVFSIYGVEEMLKLTYNNNE